MAVALKRRREREREKERKRKRGPAQEQPPARMTHSAASVSPSAPLMADGRVPLSPSPPPSSSPPSPPTRAPHSPPRRCTTPLTSDHRADRPDERQRVEQAGGFVAPYGGVMRLMGELAVTRALGDAQYRPWLVGEAEYTDWMVFEREGAGREEGDAGDGGVGGTADRPCMQHGVAEGEERGGPEATCPGWSVKGEGGEEREAHETQAAGERSLECRAEGVGARGELGGAMRDVQAGSGSYLVLASDGVFEKMRACEVCDTVRREVRKGEGEGGEDAGEEEGEGAGEEGCKQHQQHSCDERARSNGDGGTQRSLVLHVADTLCSKALRKGSLDNVATVILHLPLTFRGTLASYLAARHASLAPAPAPSLLQEGETDSGAASVPATVCHSSHCYQLVERLPRSPAAARLRALPAAQSESATSHLHAPSAAVTTVPLTNTDSQESHLPALLGLARQRVDVPSLPSSGAVRCEVQHEILRDNTCHPHSDHPETGFLACCPVVFPEKFPLSSSFYSPTVRCPL